MVHTTVILPSIPLVSNPLRPSVIEGFPTLSVSVLYYTGSGLHILLAEDRVLDRRTSFPVSTGTEPLWGSSSSVSRSLTPSSFREERRSGDWRVPVLNRPSVDLSLGSFTSDTHKTGSLCLIPPRPLSTLSLISLSYWTVS